MNVKMRETNLQREVEELRVAQETQRLRAGELTMANVHAKAIVAQSEGEAKALKSGPMQDCMKNKKKPMQF